MSATPIDSLQEIYKRPGFMLKRMHQVAMALFLEECKCFGITPSQHQALSGVHSHPGIAQSALGRLIGQDRSTIALVVKSLLDRGLITMTANSADRRSVCLTLEPAGEQMLRQVAPAARRAQEKLLAPLPKEQREAFLVLLTALLDAHGALIDSENLPRTRVTKNRLE
jgi:MarR family transcriptional regulator, lower aerobic nicotinate degradation pathway regulator